MVKNKHFHPNHPENHNIIIPNVSKNQFLVKGEHKNEIKNGNDVLESFIEDMKGNVRDLMETYEDNITDNYKEQKLKRLTTMLDNVENKVGQTVKKLKRDIKVMCQNNQQNYKYEWTKKS